jgi:predicted TIM-barrel fold metal-dependent hydrolase
LECAKDLDLIVTPHAGFDAGYPDAPIRCTPERARRVIEKVGHKKLILAHLGGNQLTEAVIDTLCGTDVYFDTSYSLRFVGKESFMKILEKHGEDKILFASDSPWSDIASDAEILRSYKLNKKTEEKIFCENAKKLLGI